MVPITSPPSRRRLSPLSIPPRAQCIQRFPPSVPPPQKINPGTPSEESLTGRDEEVTSLQTSTSPGGPATFTSTPSAQKGVQAQHPASPSKEGLPESATIPQGPPPGIPPSFSDPLPDNECNSTSTANPPIVPEKGSAFKFPYPHFSDPGSKGETRTADVPLPCTTTTAASPSGSGKARPSSFPGTDQLPRPKDIPAPSETSAHASYSATPPAQTTTSSDGGGAAIASPTITHSTSITGMEAGASFPTGEVYSSRQPATSSRAIKSAFVYATLLVETTRPTGGVPVPTGSSHNGHSVSVNPLIISLTTFTTYSLITTHGQVSSTPLTVTSVATVPTTVSQSPNDPATADATSSNSTKSAVTGGVVCAAIFLLAGSLLVLFLVRRRRRRRTSSRRADTHTFPTLGGATLSPSSIPEKPDPMQERSVVEGRSGHFNSIPPADNSISPHAVIPRTAELSSLLLSAATFGSDSSHHSPRHTPNGSVTSFESTHELPSAHGHPYWGPVLQQARETLVSLGSAGQRPADTIVSRASLYSPDSVASSSSLPFLAVNVAERQVTPDPFADPESNPFDDPTIPTTYIIVRPGTRLSLAPGRVSPNSMSVND